jgi:hypothetical protein
LRKLKRLELIDSSVTSAGLGFLKKALPEAQITARVHKAGARLPRVPASIGVR